MKRFTTLITLALVTVLATATLGVSTGKASAAQPDCFTYGQATSTTPVFNNICDVGQQLPSTDGNYPIGNERDFVRIRQNVNGDDTISGTNPKLQDNLTATCKAGDKYDVWTYVHNDASADQNGDGTGTAVAKNVQLALAAGGVNTTASNFTFKSTVTASNADTVTDTATLNCGGKQVMLKLVPRSVHYNNTTNAAPSWAELSDGFVNGTNAIGNPVFGSGTQYGCFDYRTIVVYEVVVQDVPAPQVTATCDLFTLTADDRKVTVPTSGFKFTATNVTANNVVIDWGDSTTATTVTDLTKVEGTTHTYAKDGTYVANAVVHFSNDTSSGGAGTACSQKLVFSSQNPPVITTVTTTPTPTVARPTKLVNTGAGSTIGIFAAVSAIGAVAHRYFLGRRLTN